jgi:hypothetical protein
MSSVARLRADLVHSRSQPPELALVAGGEGRGESDARGVIRPDALSYHRLKPDGAGPADIPLLGAAYECWSAVWKEHLYERDKLEYLPSDEFTRQDEIGVLFHEWECVGMTFYRWVDLTNPVFADDSYFRVWPAAALKAACARGPRLCIGSNLTVAPRWRRAIGCSVKQLLLALAIERFRRSGADAMVGKMRNDRGMNKVGLQLGFERLEEGVFLHGGPCDLVAFYRQSSQRPMLDATTEGVITALRP